jgi:uncharacterized protein YndB with AHSA1/START domain
MIEQRTDSGRRVVKATPHAVYQAHLNAEAVASWRPPQGMRARIYTFEPREGGSYRMAFEYTGDHPGRGKTTEHADIFRGEFVELVPDERIVERVTFESADPAFAEPMTVTTVLTPVADGTEVAIVCTDVPSAISAEDHQKGIASTLENLAAFTE